MDQSSFQDWYAILEVAPDASLDQIRQAWRRQAQKHHPDRNRETSDSARFISAKKAFEVLSSPGLRSQFDLNRQAWLASQQSTSSLVSAGPSFSFRQWWSDLRKDSIPQVLPQGDRASFLLRVPLNQIFQDTHHTIRLRVARTCLTCRGRTSRCGACGGTGQRLVPGMWSVRVPAGTPDRAILRLSGQGHQGPRFGSPGDVFVTVSWSHRGPWRWRDGRLVARLKVRKSQLEKGASLRIRSPEGRWGRFDVQPGPLQARLVRLPGIGLPLPSGTRADAWVECFFED